MAEASQICKFYDGLNVFVTGGTGFMGKVLLEKLLRSTDVSTIFLLIREKKGKNVHARLDDIFDNVIFNQLKNERPKFRHRVVAVPGDCSLTGLGMTITDRQKLISEVNVVFHVAATVRFDENLKLAHSINVIGTNDVIELSRQMKNLKSLVHVSTAYSNCYMKFIDEKIYDYEIDYEKVGTLLEKISKSEAEKLTPRIIGNWPNTYTFTKAMAESLVKNTAGNLPIGIFRPSIVISTYKEPVEGWTDNLYGPSGASAGIGSGLLRILACDDDAIADVVPVDTCVAGIIATAWDIANRTTESAANIPVYNYVSSVENSVTWGEFHTLGRMHGIKYPLQKAIWTVKVDNIPNRNLYLFLRVIFHLIPAFLLDFVSILFGQKPRLVMAYNKIHKFSDVIAYFSTREWGFANSNVIALWDKMNRTDQNLFPLSIKTVQWPMYSRNYFKGMRMYLLKDPLSTLPEARIRKRNFDIMRHFLIFFANFLLSTFIWIVILKFAAFFMTDSSANRTDDFLENVLYT